MNASVDPEVAARVAAARAENVARKAGLGPGASMVAVRTVEVPSSQRGGAVRVRLLAPTPTPDAVLVYLHGGGWVLGSIDTFDRLGRELAARSGAVVARVDYAKAPEQPYPAAVQDAWAAYAWVLEAASGVLADAGVTLAPGFRVFVGGDSAGGNLAAVVARRCAEDGVRLDGQVLVYPVTDHDLTRASYDTVEGGRDGMQQFWDLYCDPGRRAEPDASPLRAPSLASQAPALVLNAETDVLNDEIDAYAERLASQGVRVERHLIAGEGHGVLSYYDTSPAAGEALDAIAGWVRG